RVDAPHPLSPEGRGEKLRIAFACFNPLPHQIDSAYRMPLGGSESGLCYLAEALAQRGHEVTVLHPAGTGEVSRGVRCLALTNAVIGQLPPPDAFVVQTLAGQARNFRPLLAPQTSLILWTGHALDQPAVQALHDPAERLAYDAFALVSEWQRTEFVH